MGEEGKRKAREDFQVQGEAPGDSSAFSEVRTLRRNHFRGHEFWWDMLGLRGCESSGREVSGRREGERGWRQRSGCQKHRESE